jgi:ABC-type sugar transport system ATPase subunit
MALAAGESEIEKEQRGEKTPLLSVEEVSKYFGPVKAVDHVSLDIYKGEVIGIIGDNGAGKSTFLSLLVGYYQPDSGRIYYKGQPVHIASPRFARKYLGIEMVFQNLRLAPDLSVADNMFLGEEPKLFGVFKNGAKMKQDATEALKKLNSDLKPDLAVEGLSGGEKQIVAIARAVLFNRDIIIMDEPTAAISVNKVEEVLNLIKELKKLGKTVLLVSHRLEDILQVADRIVVFYHGKIRTVLENKDLKVSDLVHAMF